MSTAFNISKGKLQWYWEQARNGTNTGILVILLKNTGLESDNVLADHNSVGALLSGPNDETDFTNYARVTVAGTTVPAPTVADDTNRVILTLPDQTWADAGGTVNNTIGKVLLAYDGNTTSVDDNALVPLLAYDALINTDGNDMTIRFHTDGAARVN